MKRKLLIFIFLFSLIMPIKTFAYSPYVVVGGETIGIEVHSEGVYVVGFYNVNGKNIAKEAGFLIGDIIIKLGDEKIVSIDDLNNKIESAKEYEFTVIRNKHEERISLKLENEDDLIKTGLYVKDQINGIGTLSYIDPETKIFGSLGHEILESSSFSRFQIKEGLICKAEVSSIKKSSNGKAGEKQAKYDKSVVSGSIDKNEQNGIYGKYLKDIGDRKTYEVGKKEEIRKGSAQIKTVISGNDVESFDVNIISIDEKDSVKNILFEVTDSKLLDKTGGVVQGMSGSPIIQNNKIIGVVNYVIVNDTNKGYGIFITTMLEEGDKLLN